MPEQIGVAQSDVGRLNIEFSSAGCLGNQPTKSITGD
jgi:hypothetical protein